MEPNTILDHAVFQLTPTRTRCDLVTLAGKKSEKLASGLIEPFLSHLKYAKDQISKGGYSITLKPATANASWFTKATLERFVRFVNAPEVLERFVTIEKEIAQIESSVQSNEQINGASEGEGLPRSATSSKIKAESNGSHDTQKEENSKVHLHRALETRKSVLRKEQVMAYARAFVAGFEIDCIDDLLSFAEAFGALRLREACMNFMELCNKKNEDRVWMDEIAAMQAFSQMEYPYLRTSGVVLADEDNDPNQDIMMNAHFNSLFVKNQNGLTDASASDSTRSIGSSDANQAAKMHSKGGKGQMPMWTNHLQYMQNFQGPIFPHMAPYQGYHFPGMQLSPFHPGNMPWPPNVGNPTINVDEEPVASRLKKDKFSDGKGSHSLERDGSNKDNDCSSQSHLDDDERHGRRHFSAKQLHMKKNGKHSSRKVIIRNINYITSRGSEVTDSSSLDDSSGDDELADADSLKQQVEEAVVSLRKHHKGSSENSKRKEGSKKHGCKSNSTVNHDVENVVTMNSEEEKKNGNWSIFQDLLLREVDSRSNDMDSVQVQESSFTRKSSARKNSSSSKVESENQLRQPIAPDALLLERHTHTDDTPDKENNVCPIIKRPTMDEELIYSSSLGQSGNISQVNMSDSGKETSIIKSQEGEDWLIFNHQDKSANQRSEGITTFYTNHLEVEQNKKDVVIDDSFMVQNQSTSTHLDSQRETDTFIVSDIIEAGNSKRSIQDKLKQELEPVNASEPDDLHVVLGRHSSAEQVLTSWNPELDGFNESTLANAVTRDSDIQRNDSVDKVLKNRSGTKSATNKVPGGKVAGKETKSKTAVASAEKSKSETMSRSKKSPVRRTMIQQNKAEKEEENRKKMEELLIQRQKRIAERSAVKGLNRATSVKSVKESKAAALSSKVEKPELLSTEKEKKKSHKPVMRSSMIERVSAVKNTKETKAAALSTKIEKPKLLSAEKEKKKSHKPVMRSSTMERLSVARTTYKPSPTESKARQTKKVPKQGNVLSTPQKTAGALNKKPSQNNVKSSNRRTERIYNKDCSNTRNDQEKDCPDVKVSVPKDFSTGKANQPRNVNADFQNINDLHVMSSVEKKDVEMIPDKDSLDEKSHNQRVSTKDLPVPAVVQSAQRQNITSHNEEISQPSCAKDLTVTDDSVGVSQKRNIHPSRVTFASQIDEDGMGRRKFPVSPETSASQYSTPPPGNEMSPELSNSRKKRNGVENSVNFTKGIRKLIFFGRRS